MTTLGMDRVRLSFNPTGDQRVNDIKKDTANLIDICEAMKAHTTNSEVHRLLALAQTHYEDAAMWAVKAATA